MNQIPMSEIAFLDNEFQDIIHDSKNGDSTGQVTKGSTLRHTFFFRDGTKLSITEFTKHGFIEKYHYDWMTKDGKEILKFHSEPHPHNKRYQTKTEPFHIHRSKYHPAHLSNLDRYSNVYHQNLYSILEFLRFHILASETIQAINPPVAPKTKVNK